MADEERQDVTIGAPPADAGDESPPAPADEPAPEPAPEDDEG
jgi:hypothetical protein